MMGVIFANINALTSRTRIVTEMNLKKMAHMKQVAGNNVDKLR